MHRGSSFIAEVSYPTTGLGIELGWADVFEVPIVCVHRKDAKISKSLSVLTDKFIEYANNTELITGIKEIIKVIEE